MRILDNSFVLFVDADNIFFGARNQQTFQENTRIDYKVLKEVAFDGRSFAFSYAKVFASMRYVNPDVFAGMLKRNGFFSRIETRSQDTAMPSRDLDVIIAVEAVTYRVDGMLPSVISVASGDTDFMPVYEYLKSFGVRIEVLSFKDSLARDVSNFVDRVILLDNRVTFSETRITEAHEGASQEMAVSGQRR